jgi:hypothetical protein
MVLTVDEGVIVDALTSVICAEIAFHCGIPGRSFAYSAFISLESFSSVSLSGI